MRIRRMLIVPMIFVGLMISGYSRLAAMEELPMGEPYVDELFDMVEYERKQEMLDLALSYKPLLKQMERRADAPSMITEDGITEIIQHIAEYGHTATAMHQNMENHQQFDDFLVNIDEGVEGASYYYLVGDSGGFTRMDFEYEAGRLYLTESSLMWDEEMNPVVRYFTNFHIIEKWEYTEKGYFLYKPTSDPKFYACIRVIPLDAKYREFCQTYISLIGYQGNNLFIVDWDQDNMEEIAFNDLYDALYYLDMGKPTKYDLFTQSIPADEFEPVFIKYFGITAGFLREHALYYEYEDAYFWNYLHFNKHYVLIPAPIPEVVDSWENEDGTLTMVVDALDEERGNDRAFTHEVTVRVHADDSFQYISNHIWPEDRERVPGYTPRWGEYFSSSSE